MDDPALSRPPNRITKTPDGALINSVDWGSADVDATGTVRANLLVSLDYFPLTRPNIATLPKCIQPLAPDFELGRIQCEGGTLDLPLEARHVNQECYAGTDGVKVVAQEAIKVAGCKRVKFVGYSFDPDLRLDVEKRL